MSDLKLYNLLDTMKDRLGVTWVYFHATVDDLERKTPTLVMLVEKGVARVGSCRCLPVYGWVPYAEATQRALEFVRVNKLETRQP